MHLAVMRKRAERRWKSYPFGDRPNYLARRGMPLVTSRDIISMSTLRHPSPPARHASAKRTKCGVGIGDVIIYAGAARVVGGMLRAHRQMRKK